MYGGTGEPQKTAQNVLNQLKVLNQLSQLDL